MSAKKHVFLVISLLLPSLVYGLLLWLVKDGIITLGLTILICHYGMFYLFEHFVESFFWELKIASELIGFAEKKHKGKIFYNY